MNKPLVSVVMITYGHEKYIEQAISGVLMQECDFDIELIIANDNSPDNTDAIIQQILKEHINSSWIKYIKHKNNIGMMKNFINTLLEAQGKYIALCEGDDYWTDPLKLKKQITFLEANPNISFTFHGSKTIDNNGVFGSYFRHVRFLDHQIVPIKHCLENGGASFSTASAVYKKEIVEDMPEWFKTAAVGDYPLLFLALEKGDIGYLEDEMCVYRINSESSWSSKNLSIKNRLGNYRKAVNLNKLINRETKGKYKKYLQFSVLSYIWSRIKFAVKLKYLYK